MPIGFAARSRAAAGLTNWIDEGGWRYYRQAVFHLRTGNRASAAVIQDQKDTYREKNTHRGEGRHTRSRVTATGFCSFDGYGPQIA